MHTFGDILLQIKYLPWLIQNICHKIASVTLHKQIVWVRCGSSISETSAATPTYSRMDFCQPILCIQIIFLLYTISRIESVYHSVSNPFIPEFPIITSPDPLLFYVISFNGQGQI